MDVPIWVSWATVALFAVLSSILLMGKGSFLIAGYNTKSKEHKAKYNAKKLCRVVGCGLSIITVIMGVGTYYEFELPLAIDWLIPWGYLGTIAVILILANTICGVKKEK
ncbi:MAG: DUF3784 domain-containing protein [Oscillospiraceae bacterium]|nr:DUF3784 domain-containing protein [Oscillospiraceae bacterium]